MAIQTTSNLSNSITTVVKAKYLEGAQMMRLYDQIAVDYTKVGSDGKSMDELMMGSSITVPYIGDMNPGTAAISETADVTPQTVRDTTASVTPTSLGEALMWSENLTIQAYTDYVGEAYKKIGKNAMESIDIQARNAALQGNWVERAVARASLDAGTASHRASDSIFRKYDGLFQSLMIPGYVGENGVRWVAIMHPFVFHDISESGNVDVIGQYLDKSIHLNWQLGDLGSFRILSSPYAKVFGAAGVDAASNVNDTLASSVNQLATSITTSSDVSTNIVTSLLVWIGTEETAGTHYATNEPVRVLSASGTTVTVMGQSPNGGLRFDHAAATAVRNADSAYTIVFAGPESLVKVYATDVGMYGKEVGPKVYGTLDQFNTLGWKWYGAYALLTNNRLMRFECSTSYEA